MYKNEACNISILLCYEFVQRIRLWITSHKILCCETYWPTVTYICRNMRDSLRCRWLVSSKKSGIRNHAIQHNIPEDLNPYMNMFTYECLCTVAGCYSRYWSCFEWWWHAEVGYITNVIAVLFHCPGCNDSALKRKTVKVSESFATQPTCLWFRQNQHTHTHVLKYATLECPPFLPILMQMIILHAGISYCLNIYIFKKINLLLWDVQMFTWVFH